MRRRRCCALVFWSFTVFVSVPDMRLSSFLTIASRRFINCCDVDSLCLARLTYIHLQTQKTTP